MLTNKEDKRLDELHEQAVRYYLDKPTSMQVIGYVRQNHMSTLDLL